MKNFGKIIRKYLGQSFEECNCLQFLDRFYKDVDIDIFPDNYNGYNLTTYIQYWKENPKQATTDMLNLFKTIGKEINPKFPKVGDILIIEFNKKSFPSIYTGDNNVMAVSIKSGVVVMPLGNKFKRVIGRRVL